MPPDLAFTYNIFFLPQAGEKLVVQDTTKGDVIMKLVPLIDNFEAAKNAIKVQTDAEQKIVDSYQVKLLTVQGGRVAGCILKSRR